MNNKLWWKAAVLLVVVILCLQIFASNAYWVERGYAQGLYLQVGGLIASITESVPFSLFEWMVGGVLLLFTILFLRFIVLWLQKRLSFLRALMNLLLRYGVLCAILYVWFLLVWGLNYHRLPLSVKLGLGTIRAENHHFIAAAEWATAEMTTLYSDDFPDQVDAAVQSVLQSLDRVLEKMNEKAPAGPRRFKHLWWNYPFEVTRTYGMISPFTLEPHLSSSLFPVEIPFLAAHEAAHVKGYASETEANLLAFEACLESAQPLARFSGFFSIFTYLCHAVPHDELVRLFNSWPQEIKDIEKRIEERDHQHAGAFLDGVRIAYDLYLKFNSVQDGVKSYSRAGGWVAVIHHQEALRAFEATEDLPGDRPSQAKEH